MKNLFPPYFKILGKVMIALGFLHFFSLPIIMEYFPEVTLNKDLYWDIILLPFILGLFFMDFSQGNNADTLFSRTRVRSLYPGLIGGLLYVLSMIYLAPLSSNFGLPRSGYFCLRCSLWVIVLLSFYAGGAGTKVSDA